MERDEPDRHLDAAARPIVAFDFDGTLTCRDSFTAFLAWDAGAARFAQGMARLAWAAARYGRDRDRGRLKAAMVAAFLAGMQRTELAARGVQFAAQCSPKFLRADAVSCWERWKIEGARLVIVTASPEILVAPFARALGAERLIGTRLAFDADDRVTGALEGPNCRGPAKVGRLQETFGADVRLRAAYGDSDGDREMLAMADEAGLRVFTEGS